MDQSVGHVTNTRFIQQKNHCVFLSEVGQLWFEEIGSMIGILACIREMGLPAPKRKVGQKN